MTKTKKVTKRDKGQTTSKVRLDAVPSNWCDPLLTGKNAVIGQPPYDCQDIERLLNAVRERLMQASNKD